MSRTLGSFRTGGTVLAPALAACGGDDAPASSPIHFSDLVDGAYLSGALT